ncbi:MAG: methyl-accepting chemotaxis protein [Clostridiales bacterium]|nr:methyl-accepting chemotaxis protein [Clostridiales bacterium]
MSSNQNSIISKNEREANHFVAKVMRISAAFMVVILILNIVGIFSVDQVPMIVGCTLVIILLLVPTLLVDILKLQHESLKYIFVGISILFVCILTLTMNWHAVLVFIYAISIASMYFSKRLNWLATGLSIVCFSIAQYIAYRAGLTTDRNQVSDYATIVYCIIPRALSLFAVSCIFTSLNTRTTKLLKNLMDADQQARIMKHMKKMQDKSLEVSDSLLNAVNVLNDVTDNTTEINKEIANRTSATTNGSGETLEQLNEVGDNFSIISTNLNSLAQKTSEISDISQNVFELTTNNTRNMANVIKEMDHINETTQSSKETILHLENRSQEILQIVDVITNISKQTNLLALNAAIESARAGEAGHGFSVVADEIRKLAEQTQGAVANIKTIVEEVVTNTAKASESMEQSAKSVNDGLQLIRIAEASTSQVTEASSEMTQKISEIDVVTKNVAESSEKIVEIVKSVEDISTQNLDDLQEIAQSTESNLEDMTKLQELVDNINEMASELNSVVHDN